MEWEGNEICVGIQSWLSMRTKKRLNWKAFPWIIAQEYVQGSQKKEICHRRRCTIQFWVLLILESWVDIQVEASDRVENWDWETLHAVINAVRIDDVTELQK